MAIIRQNTVCKGAISMKSKANFWKKNAYYIIIAVCATAIVVLSTFALINLGGKTPVDKPNNIIDQNIDDNKNTDDDNKNSDLPTDTKIVFCMPVRNVEVIKYSTTADVPVMLDLTTGYYKSHVAMDFGGAAGDDVLAVFDGTIESATKDELLGTIITINHGEGLTTVYKSLADPGNFKAGDMVKKGDKIGEMSTSYRIEELQGAHLHFEVLENGIAVNPEKYLVFEEK